MARSGAADLLPNRDSGTLPCLVSSVHIRGRRDTCKEARPRFEHGRGVDEHEVRVATDPAEIERGTLVPHHEFELPDRALRTRFAPTGEPSRGR
jgi:hypothetical protein